MASKLEPGRTAPNILLPADGERALAPRDYRVSDDKSTHARSIKGMERTTLLVDHKGKISRSWRKVTVADRAIEVLQAAQRLD